MPSQVCAERGSPSGCLAVHLPLPSESASTLSQDQIRLLYFLPSTDDDIVIGHAAWQRSEAPPYAAISYTWGDAGQEMPIVVDGATFLVRKNCHEALSTARRHYQGHFFWIDSICIRQSNVVERNNQVTNMGNVYRDAERVLACPGGLSVVHDFPYDVLTESLTQDDVTQIDSEIMIDVLSSVLSSMESYLRNLAREAGVDTADPVKLLDPDHWASSSMAILMQPCIDAIEEALLLPLRHALLSFSGLHYWKRLWVLQETIAAGPRLEICIGGNAISWLQLRFAIALFGGAVEPYKKYSKSQESLGLVRLWPLDHGKIKHSTGPTWSRKYDHKDQWEESMRLFLKMLGERGYSARELRNQFAALDLHTIPTNTALKLASHRQCTDARDKLYAISALLCSDKIIADYNKSVLEVSVDAYRLLCVERSFQPRSYPDNLYYVDLFHDLFDVTDEQRGTLSKGSFYVESRGSFWGSWNHGG